MFRLVRRRSGREREADASLLLETLKLFSALCLDSNFYKQLERATSMSNFDKQVRQSLSL